MVKHGLPLEQEERIRGVGQGKRTELGWHHSPPQVEIDTGNDDASRQQLVTQSQRAQDLERARMHDQGARRAERLGAALDDTHIGAEARSLESSSVSTMDSSTLSAWLPPLQLSVSMSPRSR